MKHEILTNEFIYSKLPDHWRPTSDLNKDPDQYRTELLEIHNTFYGTEDKLSDTQKNKVERLCQLIVLKRLRELGMSGTLKSDTSKAILKIMSLKDKQSIVLNDGFSRH